MKTLIAIPCMDTLPVDFTKSLLNLTKGPDVDVAFKPNSLIYDARNLLSAGAIEHGYDYVMWFDSDMAFPPDTLHKLLSVAVTHDAPMVTGVYVKRYLPTKPVLYSELDPPTVDADNKPVRHITEYVNYPRDHVFPVRGCGFGVCLTSTKLLKEVWDAYGPAFAPFPWAGEDISFCHRVNLLGHTILCDPSVSVGHIGKFIYSDILLKDGDSHEETV